MARIIPIFSQSNPIYPFTQQLFNLFIIDWYGKYPSSSVFLSFLRVKTSCFCFVWEGDINKKIESGRKKETKWRKIQTKKGDPWIEWLYLFYSICFIVKTPEDICIDWIRNKALSVRISCLALQSVFLHDVAGNDQPLDFGSAFVNLGNPGIPKKDLTP